MDLEDVLYSEGLHLLSPVCGDSLWRAPTRLDGYRSICENDLKAISVVFNEAYRTQGDFERVFISGSVCWVLRRFDFYQWPSWSNSSSTKRKFAFVGSIQRHQLVAAACSDQVETTLKSSF